MRIISRQELLHLPEGTIYSDFDDGIIMGLFKKIQTNKEGEDWSFIDVLNPQFGNNTSEYMNEVENGEEIDYEVSEEIDAEFDDSSQYIVYSKNDVKKIINLLKR